MGWDIAGLFFLLAALCQIQPASDSGLKPGWVRPLNLLMKVLPLLTVLLSFAFVFYMIAMDFGRASGWLLVGAILLAMLFGARQMLAPSFINPSVRAKLILTFLLVSLFTISLVAFLRMSTCVRVWSWT